MPFVKSLLLMLFTLAATGAQAQGKGGQAPKARAEPIDAPACGALPTGTQTLVCQCPQGFSAGSVWGSGPYTADSDICTAARHAGVIGAAGGVLQLVLRDGQSSYQGSKRNGVSTSSWGAYNQSFEILPAGTAIPVTAPSLPACGTLPGDAATLRCHCDAGAGSGSVWGSGPYTADSDICTAARHAGVLGGAGGTVDVLRIDGLAAYSGTSANGVTTSGWGSYGSSIVFNRN